MLNYSSEIKIRSLKTDDFYKDFSKHIENSLKNAFSRVYVGEKKIEFENNALSFFIIWNFFEIISEAVITINQNNSLFLIRYNINYSRYVIFWFGITAVATIGMIYNDFEESQIIGLPLLWGAMGYLFTQISLHKFRSAIIETAKLQNAKIIK